MNRQLNRQPATGSVTRTWIGNWKQNLVYKEVILCPCITCVCTCMACQHNGFSIHRHLHADSFSSIYTSYWIGNWISNQQLNQKRNRYPATESAIRTWIGISRSKMVLPRCSRVSIAYILYFCTCMACQMYELSTSICRSVSTSTSRQIFRLCFFMTFFLCPKKNSFKQYLTWQLSWAEHDTVFFENVQFQIN